MKRLDLGELETWDSVQDDADTAAVDVATGSVAVAVVTAVAAAVAVAEAGSAGDR